METANEVVIRRGSEEEEHQIVRAETEVEESPYDDDMLYFDITVFGEEVEVQMEVDYAKEFLAKQLEGNFERLKSRGGEKDERGNS